MFMYSTIELSSLQKISPQIKLHGMLLEHRAALGFICVSYFPAAKSVAPVVIRSSTSKTLQS